MHDLDLTTLVFGTVSFVTVVSVTDWTHSSSRHASLLSALLVPLCYVMCHLLADVCNSSPDLNLKSDLSPYIEDLDVLFKQLNWVTLQNR